MCAQHYGDGSSSRVYIDARSFGGLCRFVNHSCGPNLVALPVRADSSLPRVCFFAACDVPAGAELCIDFGDGKWSPPDPLPADLSALVRCLCGTELCKGFLPMSVTGEEGEGQEG